MCFTLHESRLNKVSKALPVSDRAASASSAFYSVSVFKNVTTNKEKTTSVYQYWR